MHKDRDAEARRRRGGRDQSFERSLENQQEDMFWAAVRAYNNGERGECEAYIDRISIRIVNDQRAVRIAEVHVLGPIAPA